MDNSTKLYEILQHIKRVEENCNMVAEKLILINPAFAMAIAHRGRVHDASKLQPLEFEHLWLDSPKFETALKHHHSLNSHHPEHYSNGIYGMSDLDICEMVCDCVARAQESGKDARHRFFAPEEFPKRFGYSNDEAMYKKIELYMDLILKKPFTQK